MTIGYSVSNPKQIKGEKYAYLLMAYQLAKQNNGGTTIGHDSGMKGGQNYWRRFDLTEYDGIKLISETKTTASFTNFTRYYQINPSLKIPVIREYIDENGDNLSKWNH